jgi:hypothetical protein
MTGAIFAGSYAAAAKFSVVLCLLSAAALALLPPALTPAGDVRFWELGFKRAS